MDAPPIDLLIIGAGPVGLATAVGALHRGAKRVLVVEQARELRPLGGPLNLLPNAVRALHAIAPGLRERFEPFVRIPQPGTVRGVTVSTSGTFIRAKETADYGAMGSLLWWQLQQLLLDALPDPGIVVLNHQLADIKYEDGTGYALADFVANRQRENKYRNWDEKDSNSAVPTRSVPGGDYDYSSIFEACEKNAESSSVQNGNERWVRCRAKVIVGADGINSVARRCVYRDAGGWEDYAEAMYSGFTRVAAAGSPSLSADDQQILKDRYLRNGELSFITCEQHAVSRDSMRLMVAQRKRDSKIPSSLYIGYYFTVDEQIARNSSPNEIARVALDVAGKEGLHQQLLQLSRDIWDSTDKFYELPFYVVPATHPPPFAEINAGGKMNYPANFNRPWHFKRVVLAGDAAHAAPPFLSQGGAMGLEDAHVLVTCLAKAGVFSKTGDSAVDENTLGRAFKSYYSTRIDRICFFQNKTMNRTSEYDGQAVDEKEETLWKYDPVAAAENISCE